MIKALIAVVNDVYRTALMLAAEGGMTAVCDYLMSRGADVIALDHQGTVTVMGNTSEKIQILQPKVFKIQYKILDVKSI